MQVRAPAHVVEEPDLQIEWATPDLNEVSSIERALADYADPVPEGEPSQKMATGSGPATPPDGNPMVHPSDRKRAQSRPSMKAVLAGEIDTESELDVPTFIRRHSSTTHG